MSTRDKAVEIAQQYLVIGCPGSTDDSDSNAEVENMIDLIIEAAATKAANTAMNIVNATTQIMDEDLAVKRRSWISANRGTLAPQIVALLEKAYKAGWVARGTKGTE